MYGITTALAVSGEDEIAWQNYDNFMKSYELVPNAGIRVNTLKISREEFMKLSPLTLRPSWCSTGYYTQAGERPGRHPYYHAGLYYIQEPSAMAPVELLGVTSGIWCWTCARRRQIYADCGEAEWAGVLVSNDLHPDRTKALAKNLEMYGVRNAVVLNEDPDRIAGAFPEFFTKILIDALFRRRDVSQGRVHAEVLGRIVSAQVCGYAGHPEIGGHAPLGRPAGVLHLYLLAGGE